MQTITTRYTGRCILAKASGGASIRFPYPHELHDDEKHKAAAVALMAKLGWTGEMVGGDNKGGGMTFVFIDGPRISREVVK
jgi:hypothetical protein